MRKVKERDWYIFVTPLKSLGVCIEGFNLESIFSKVPTHGESHISKTNKSYFLQT